jgi:putative ABC transport system permease protein
MIRLALGLLRENRGSHAGTFVAVLMAIALLSGGGLLLFSVLTAPPPADRFAAAAAVVADEREVAVESVTVKQKHTGSGDERKVKRKVKTERLTGAGTLRADLADRLAALPGVSRAVPDAAFLVRLSTADGTPIEGAGGAPVVGHGWRSAPLTPYSLRAGDAPKADEVVLDADLAARAGATVGDTVVVTSKTGTHPLRVSGIAGPRGRKGLAAQGALFIADTRIRAVSGLTGPTAIAVFVGPGADTSATVSALRTEAGDAEVFTGAEKVRGDLPSALPDYIGPISLFGLLIGITAFGGLFVLTGTAALAVRQQLRDLALLRTAGATPGQLLKLLKVQIIVVAAVAAVPAAPLGVLLARLVSARFRMLRVVPQQFTVSTDVRVLGAAALAGALVALVAAHMAGRKAVRIAPTHALTVTGTAPVVGMRIRAVAAVAPAGAAAGLLILVPLDGPLGMGMSFLASALLLCAVAAIGPLFVRLLASPTSRLAGLCDVTGWLAGMVVRSETRRATAVALPLVLMFAINAPMLLNSTLLGRLTAGEQSARTAPATATVAGPSGLPLKAARRLAALPGVTGAAATLPTRVVVAHGGKPEDYVAQGLLLTGTDPALDLDVSEGVIGGADTMAASRYMVHLHGWQVGQHVPVWLADGVRVDLVLAAVYERSRGFGDLVLPARLVAAHDPSGLVGNVMLRCVDSVVDQIRAESPTLRVAPTAEAPTGPDAQNQQGAFEVMMVISLGFTAISVINTFSMATAARRREYADLRLAGATVGQIHRLATREAAITVTVGLLMGVAVTTVVVSAFSLAQDGTLRLIVDPATYGALLGGVAVLGLLAGVLPARLLLRRSGLPIGTEGGRRRDTGRGRRL